ncbi:hypothetical protein GGI24_004774, partial [Coemansia furcata]
MGLHQLAFLNTTDRRRHRLARGLDRVPVVLRLCGIIMVLAGHHYKARERDTGSKEAAGLHPLDMDNSVPVDRRPAKDMVSKVLVGRHPAKDTVSKVPVDRRHNKVKGTVSSAPVGHHRARDIADRCHNKVKDTVSSAPVGHHRARDTADHHHRRARDTAGCHHLKVNDLAERPYLKVREAVKAESLVGCRKHRALEARSLNGWQPQIVIFHLTPCRVALRAMARRCLSLAPYIRVACTQARLGSTLGAVDARSDMATV